ncbi:MAG: radical SAM protein [Candidatus Sumerlaeia bacterium]
MARPRDTRPSTPDRRALLAAERGPGCIGGGPIRVALVYPNSYHIGMSSLGFQLTMQAIGNWGARAERFFIDTFTQGSIETGAAASDFDVVAFSATYELDAPHVLDALEWSGLPLESRRRGPGWPLVVMGGLLASVNRLPLYPFIDVFAHGDAERLVPGLLDLVARERAGELGRRDVLEALGEQPGLEVTAGAREAAGLEVPAELTPLVDLLDRDGEAQLPRPPAPRLAFLDPLDGSPCASSIITPHTEFAEMGLIDLARGCPHHCTFCWLGHHSPAYRVRPAEEVVAAAGRLMAHTDRLGLVASAVGAHPRIDLICEELMKRGAKISFSSLRVEDVTPAMLRALHASGQKSATIAPEAGSVRVRRLLGKPISDDQVLAVAEEIFGLGIESLKMYFMIGVPTETDDEALEIAAFVEKVRAVQLKWARPRGRMGSLGINLGLFVPKPGLPLLKLEPVPLARKKKRLARVARALERIPNTRVAASSPELARSQEILSMGGAEAARYVMAARQSNLDWRAANREYRH